MDGRRKSRKAFQAKQVRVRHGEWFYFQIAGKIGKHRNSGGVRRRKEEGKR